MRLQAQLLDVQQKLGCIFFDARNGRELVVDALDAHGRDGGAWQRRQQDAAQRITESEAEATLQGINLEAGIVLRLLQDLHLGIELFEQFGRTSGRASYELSAVSFQ